jgi:hypothetical protein
MQLKVYVPKIVEIPGEYLSPLAKRAGDCLGTAASSVPATRGHLVRQAIRDGLLREFDALVGPDESVDIFCDPSGEIPLEIDNRTVTLSELMTSMNNKRPANAPRPDEAKMDGIEARPHTIPLRKSG